MTRRGVVDRVKTIAWSVLTLLGCRSDPQATSAAKPDVEAVVPAPSEAKSEAKAVVPPTSEPTPPPPVLPKCAAQAELRPMSTVGAPQMRFQYGGVRFGDRILVSARDEALLRLSTYALRSDTWKPLSTAPLPEIDDVLPAIVASARFVVIAYDRRGKAPRFAAYDVAQDRWSDLVVPEMPGVQPRIQVYGERVIVVPNFGCAHLDWANAVGIDLTTGARFELAAPADARAWRSEEHETIGRHEILWGGKRTDAEFGEGSDCSEATTVRPTDDTAILDAHTGRWRAVVGGPKTTEESFSAATSDAFFVVVAATPTARVWRLDVGDGVWAELGGAPSGLFMETPQFASLVTKEVGGRTVLLRMREQGAVAAIVEADGTIREAAPGPVARRAAAEVAIDDRLLVLPQEGVLKDRVVYVLDARNGRWCELEWPVADTMWDDEGSPYFRVTESYDGRAYLWAPGSEGDVSGISVTLPRW